METTTPPPAPTQNWRLYMELLSFAFFFFPFGNILGPLILWLVKKDSEPAVDAAGKQVLNFNISWTIWSFVTCGVGFFVWLVLAVIASIKAANNEPYEHPLTLKIIN